MSLRVTEVGEIMDSLSIICIVLGTLGIVLRGPLIFAPSATLRFYDRWILSSNARVRTFGVVIATLAMTLLLLPLGDGALARLLQAFGWIVAAMALCMLVLSDGFHRFGRAMVSFF